VGWGGWEPDRQGEAHLTSEWLGNFTLPCGENQAEVRVQPATGGTLSGTSLPLTARSHGTAQELPPGSWT
jgi:hypothetical protein